MYSKSVVYLSLNIRILPLEIFIYLNFLNNHALWWSGCLYNSHYGLNAAGGKITDGKDLWTSHLNVNTSSPSLPHDTPLPSHTRLGGVCVDSSYVASSQYPSLAASLTLELDTQAKPRPSLKPAGPEPDPDWSWEHFGIHSISPLS